MDSIMSDINMQDADQDQGDELDQEQEQELDLDHDHDHDNIANQYASSYDRRQALPEQRADESEQDYRKRLARNERSRIYNKARNAKKRALNADAATPNATQSRTASQDNRHNSHDRDSLPSDHELASSPPRMHSPKLNLDAASNVDSDTPKPSIKSKAKSNGDKKTGGKKSNRALQAEEGLERTDNGMAFSSWPDVAAINQKNYYTEYMKRDDQVLTLRLGAEASRDKMMKNAKDRDRALARTGDTDVPVVEAELEDEDDDADAARTVVIHLGSQNLRIGFASDALPKTIPMCMAMEDIRNEAQKHEARPKRQNVEGQSPDQQFGDDYATWYARVCNELKLDMRANKRKVLPNSKELVINFNRRAPPEKIPEHNDAVRVEFTEPKPKEDYYGETAQRIPDFSNPTFRLFWPIRHGWLNEDDYNDRAVMIMCIDRIIFTALRDHLGIKTFSDLKQYKCVFVIPDLYEKKMVEALVDVFFKEYEFSRVCLIQESMAASFGAGYTTGCIIDVGAQKTSIACVEDGMIFEDSRINLKFGGHDVTEAFIKMMMFDSFPYGDINLMRRYDFLLAEELKQKFCTMNQAEISVQLYNFHLRAPNEPTRKYQFKTYDEVILAPMGFYDPMTFDHSDKLNGRRKLMQRSYDAYDVEIPNDPLSRAQMDILYGGRLVPMQPNGAHLHGFANANGDGLSTPAKEKASFNFPPHLDGGNTNGFGTPGTSNPGSPAPEATPANSHTPFQFGANGNGGGNGYTQSPGPDPVQFGMNGGFPQPPVPNPFMRTHEAQTAAEERDSILPVAPLDHAVCVSIQHAAKGDERKLRDLFGSIMVIGGGAKTPGFGPFLETRLKQKMPHLQDKNILVGTSPREMDGQVVVWKGASVFGKLNATNDTWLTPFEWERLGARAFHHKVAWNW